MSLIADALNRVQKTRMEQAQKPGGSRLRGILPPLEQTGSRRKFLKNRLVLLGAFISLAVLVIVIARPFLSTVRFRESKQTDLKDQGPAPAAREPLSISRQPVGSSLPARDRIQLPASTQEKDLAQKTDNVSVPSPVESSIPFDYGQKPEPGSDLAQQITSGSKLSETVRYHYNLGVTYQKQGQLAQAEKEYEKVVQLDPLNMETHNNLGLLYKDMGQLDAAIEEYQKAISIDPGYWKAHHNLGVVFYLEGNLEMASAEYRAALKLNPKDLGIYNNLGLIYKKQGRFGDAKEVFKEALAINPSYPDTYYNLALTSEQEGNLPAAIYNYQKFIQFSSDKQNALVEKVKKHLEELGE